MELVLEEFEGYRKSTTLKGLICEKAHGYNNYGKLETLELEFNQLLKMFERTIEVLVRKKVISKKEMSHITKEEVIFMLLED